jgi:hypothetical protein
VEQKTNLISINGTFYLRIPPALKDFLNLEVGEDKIMIVDKEKSKGRYAAFWAVKKDGKKD